MKNESLDYFFFSFIRVRFTKLDVQQRGSTKLVARRNCIEQTKRRHFAGPGSQAVDLMAHLSLLNENENSLACPMAQPRPFKDGINGRGLLLGHPQTCTELGLHVE
jgi:hypothetical protein